MDRTTKEELQSYLNKELHRPATSKFNDDELVPVMLMALGSKLDTLIGLMTEKKGSVD